MKKYDFGFYLTRFLTTYLPSQRGIKANTQLSYSFCAPSVLIESDWYKSKHTIVLQGHVFSFAYLL